MHELLNGTVEHKMICRKINIEHARAHAQRKHRNVIGYVDQLKW